jgi:hypothetical protein
MARFGVCLFRRLDLIFLPLEIKSFNRPEELGIITFTVFSSMCIKEIDIDIDIYIHICHEFKIQESKI